MSLAKGVKGRARHHIVKGHRTAKFLEYFNRFLDGDPKVTIEMVSERGAKLKAIGGNHVSKR